MAEDKNQTPPELDLPAFEVDEGALTLDNVVSDSEEVDAEFEEIEERKEKKPRMSKEEMIAAGLLPPTVDKNPVSEAVAQEVSTMKEIPVEQMTRQLPKHANAVDTNNISQLASNRGGMALDLIKVLVSNGDLTAEVNEVVKYAFALADAIQEEVDNDFKTRLVEETAKQLQTS